MPEIIFSHHKTDIIYQGKIFRNVERKIEKDFVQLRTHSHELLPPEKLETYLLIDP